MTPCVCNYKYAPPACACQWFVSVFVRVLFPRGIQFLLEVEGVFRRHPCRISGRDAEQQFREVPTASPRHRAARACGRCKDAGVDAVSRARIRTVEPYIRTMTKDPISQLNRTRPRAADVWWL